MSDGQNCCTYSFTTPGSAMKEEPTGVTTVSFVVSIIVYRIPRRAIGPASKVVTTDDPATCWIQAGHDVPTIWDTPGKRAASAIIPSGVIPWVAGASATIE